MLNCYSGLVILFKGLFPEAILSLQIVENYYTIIAETTANLKIEKKKKKENLKSKQFCFHFQPQTFLLVDSHPYRVLEHLS